ncbi:electron transfer flavoprotein subunit beta [Azospirillum sp. ST 5-10]|uniref:electron transfer flavoprotein subunit beta n=1 Tax=unclassified Azospirillum TaxID=2630922 RepID=UPI003F49F8C4
MVEVAVLLSVGRHPASGRGRRADTDARALEMALGLAQDPAVAPDGAAVHALHAGDPADVALRDYLGMGLPALTVLGLASGCDPVGPLVRHLGARRPGIVLAGRRAEGGEDSGMVPYLVAHGLDAALVPDVIGIRPQGDGGAEVLQALPRGQRRAVRVRLPFVATVHPAAPPPRPVAYGPARRGVIVAVAAEGPVDGFLAACEVAPWRPRPKLMAAGGGGSAQDRLRAATENKAGKGRLMVGVDPEEAARAIRDSLVEQGVLR